MRRLAFAFSLVLAAPLGAQATRVPEMKLYAAGKFEWKPAPPTMPKGVMIAVHEGDPAKEGPFTIRLKFPAGTKVMPHFHGATEHTTVVAGTLHIGTGDTFNEASLKPMPAGSFGFWPAGMHHFARMEGEVILQVHGAGPWTVTYVNPADDPRTRKSQP